METILIIEDDDMIRENMVELFTNEGYKTLAVANGKLGLTEAMKSISDLIVSDIMMPEMDGFEVYKGIRSEPLLSAIPFVFISALSEKSNVRSGMALGVDDYITKPFANTELITVVRNRIEKSKAIRHSLEELKTNLIRSVPHEFLTPLNAVIGFSQLLMDSCIEKTILPKDDVLEYSQCIYIAGQRLLRITQNYILYTELTIREKEIIAKINAKDDVYENVHFFLPQYLYELANIENRRNDLEITMEKADLKIGDRNLRKIIEELLGNAMKFSKNKIKVTGVLKNKEYEISIEDYGNGISETNLKNIDVFRQFDRHYSEQQGMGLGLAIVKKLCSICNCNFKLESELKRGTKATITIEVAN